MAYCNFKWNPHSIAKERNNSISVDNERDSEENEPQGTSICIGITSLGLVDVKGYEGEFERMLVGTV
jgi:hypothetical protein